MQILYVQTNTNSWDIFRSDKPCKIGAIVEIGHLIPFRACCTLPNVNSSNGWDKYGSSLDGLQLSINEDWPKLIRQFDERKAWELSNGCFSLNYLNDLKAALNSVVNHLTAQKMDLTLPKFKVSERIRLIESIEAYRKANLLTA